MNVCGVATQVTIMFVQDVLPLDIVRGVPGWSTTVLDVLWERIISSVIWESRIKSSKRGRFCSIISGNVRTVFHLVEDFEENRFIFPPF